MALRVLVVSQYFWPENFRVNELVEELVRRGHEVSVLTGRPNYPDGRVFADFRADPARFSEYRGASVVRVPMLARGRSSIALLLNYLSFVLGASLFGPPRLRGREFDLLFVFEPSPITVGVPAALLRRIKRAPLIFWVLDQWPETLSALGVVRSPAVLRMVGKLASFIYNRCDLVLAQSRAMVPLVARYTRPTERVRYFPNWIEAYEGDGTVPAPEVPVVAGAFNIMFAGNIGESQDFGSVLGAAEALRDELCIRWLVVGDGRQAEWVRGEIARRGLDGRVLLLGRHAAHRMPAFFRHADALLVSLRDEPVFELTVPGKLQSYLAAGIPVVGMLNGEGARIITESGAGFVCPSGDSEALAAAVARMRALSADERALMGARGREYATREFDRASLIGRLESWMETLAAANRDAGRRLRKYGTEDDR
ncbi:MAG: glycosyltransferase family 4 protein [Pseudomonadota bacterium]